MPAAIGAAVAAIVAFSATTIGGIVVNLALGVGLALFTAALSRPDTPPLPTPSDGQTEIRQPLSPRVKSYGTVRVSGTVWWLDAIADTLYLGLALNHGRIAEYLSFHIDENEVDINGSDEVTTTPYAANGVFLHSRLGAASETKYSEILSDFGVDDVRGDGVASILAVVEHPATAAAYQNTYPNGRPTIRATIKASVVWDPRESAQDRQTETTWEWSDNPIICLLNYLLSSDGYGIPWERVEPNLQQWKDAADVCDEMVPLAAGGSAARYRIAGTYRLTDAPADVVAKFCSTCDGRLWVKRDGSVGVAVGKFVAPSVTITNAQILGYSGLMRGQDPVRAIQGVRAEYMSPNHDYREHEAEPWPTGEDVLALGEDRTAALDLLWVPSPSQARRLMKRAYVRTQARWQGTIYTNLAGMRAIDERYINVQIDEIGVNESFEVGRITLHPGAEDGPACEIQILSVDASIDAWDETTEEGDADADTFSYVSSFSKTGTAVNVLTEAGAALGRVAYVFGANATGIPATPAGWSLVASIGPASGLAAAVYRRAIDGTEGSITVNSASGAIIVVLMQGMPNPSETVEVTSISAADLGGLHSWASIDPAFALVQFCAATSDFDFPGWGRLYDSDTKVELDDERDTVHRTGSITAQASVIIYPFGSAPPVNLGASVTDDRGTNGDIVFMAEPGG